MAEIALHTRLRAGSEADYERLHARIPAAMVAALQEAGVRDWRIWRDGQDLFHLVDVADYDAMREILRTHPANIAWQAQVARGAGGRGRPLRKGRQPHVAVDAARPDRRNAGAGSRLRQVGHSILNT